mgnify:CR=1 FL=1
MAAFQPLMNEINKKYANNPQKRQEEIVKLAQAKAAEIIAGAQTKSREMRKAAQDFVDDIMRRADEGLTANVAEVRKTRAALKHQVPTAAPKE